MEKVEYLNFRPNLPVQDLERAVAFYRDIIGLDQIQLAPEYGLAILSKQGAEVALFQNEAPVSQGAYLYVKNVEALYAYCQSQGAEINRELTTHPYGIKDFVVKDPDGHLIGIGQKVN
jgi:catechol 2,3-dioxygenase-like lactoylglutathione lyase family enzyme